MLGSPPSSRPFQVSWTTSASRIATASSWTGEPAAWAKAIARLVEDAKLRLRLGQAAAATISARWTLAHAASAMLAGFRLPFLVERASG